MKYQDFEVGSVIKITTGNGLADIIKISDIWFYSIDERSVLKTDFLHPKWEMETGFIKDFDTETILSIIHDLCVRIK